MQDMAAIKRILASVRSTADVGTQLSSISREMRVPLVDAQRHRRRAADRPVGQVFGPQHTDWSPDSAPLGDADHGGPVKRSDGLFLPSSKNGANVAGP